jgi:hypothetical protein
VTVHLFGVRPRHVPAAVVRMAVDRRLLRATPGLRFFKLVGTGDGETFTMRDADPRRWGIIATWDDPAALAAFEAGSTTMRAWRRLSDEQFRLDLEPLRSHGTWAGQAPFTPDADDAASTGPVAALTRARIRWRHARRFWSAVPPVSAALASQPGLRVRLGFGEAPIGLQGTLSVWDSATALRAFAYSDPAHRAVIRRTAELGWYAEELFARFAVTGWRGTLGGVDPLAELALPEQASDRA